MDSAARQVCKSAGNEAILKNGGAAQILQIVRGHFAPDAVAAVFQEIASFLRLRRTDQSTEAFLIESDVLRHTAESRIRIGLMDAKCIPGEVCEVPGFGHYSRQHEFFDCSRTGTSTFWIMWRRRSLRRFGGQAYRCDLSERE